MNLRKKKLAVLVSSLLVAPAYAQTTEIGTINIQGEPGGVGSGLIQQEDAAKARSSVGRAAIEKQAPTSTAFQLIQNLPGVSTFDQDGTGLFGGTLRVRGFNSNQLGITLDGAPLNDSLNYSIFIQEFADPENTCDVFLTQGSTDLDAPHVGASGGNIGISTCDPKEAFGGKVALAGGSNRYRKSFARIDSGRFLDSRARMFVSVSKAQADKFKGVGKADREHLDAKGIFDYGGGSYSKLAMLYNRMDNANYRTVSKSDIATRGPNVEFGAQPPVHQPAVGGTAQNDGTYAPNAGIFSGQTNLYQGFNNNPFINHQVSMVNHWQISPKASVDINPYHIYGYGFGGSQLAQLTESNAGTALHGGIRDINRDGDTLDTVGVYGSNTSSTNRTGLTAKGNLQWDIHNLSAGVWQDVGRSKQFGPFVAIDSAGGTSDYWLRNGAGFLQYQDGTPVASRNWFTEVTARTFFVQDNFNLMADRLNVSLALKRQSVTRNFHNYASGTGGTNAGGGDYTLDQTFANTLGNAGLRYQITDKTMAFANVGQNVRAPENNANTNLLRLAGPGYTTAVVNGVMVARDASGATIPLQVLQTGITPEKATNIDLGYRYASERVTFSGSVFYIDYKDRLANQFDPLSGQTTQFNVGNSRTTGFELEAGFKLSSAWTAYSSLSYTRARMLEDKVTVRGTGAGGAAAAVALPTSGKQLPDTPNWLASASIQYSSGPFSASLGGRYTGARFTSLVNDDKVAGYALFDLGLGYRFGPALFTKSTNLRLTVSNLFNKQYLSMTGPSGTSFTNNVNPVVTAGGTVAGNLSAAGVPTSPQFYVGAPRSIQISLTSEF